MGKMGDGGGEARSPQRLTRACPLDTVVSPFHRWENKPRALLPRPVRELKEFLTFPTPRDGSEAFVSINCVTEEHQLGVCASPRDSL